MKFKERAYFDKREEADDYAYLIHIREKVLTNVYGRENPSTGEREWVVAVCPRKSKFVMELL